jgi:hypothetical protein
LSAAVKPAGALATLESKIRLRITRPPLDFCVSYSMRRTDVDGPEFSHDTRRPQR